MSNLHRHLPKSTWILGGLAAVGILVVVVILASDRSKESGGSWVQDDRGVWVAQGKPQETPAAVREQEFLLREAQLAFAVVRNSGNDLSSGPCLGPIFQDWVADLVHDPRQPEDDDRDNQCAEYLNGTARHFIELSLDGSVVRVR